MICIEVKSASEPGVKHTVTLESGGQVDGRPVWIWDCPCMGFQHRQGCRHVDAAEDALEAGVCRIYKSDDAQSGADLFRALTQEET